MKIIKKIFLCLIFIGVPYLLTAKQLVIKMATLAPEGSPWHEILVEMGQQWKEVTDGEVILRIYPGGVAGDEQDMIRKIRIGQIHAAAVTIEGMTVISAKMNVFFIPLLVESLEELDYIRAGLLPELNTDVKRNGFKILTWADVGWVYWFTDEQIILPQALQKKKLFTWAGDYHSLRLWKKAGYHPIPLAATDILPSLQTGMINAISTNPIVALSSQWFTHTPHMLDLKWGCIIGALVISNNVWQRIPVEYQSVLLEIAEETGIKAREIIPTVDRALDVMGEHGLQIHSLSPEEKEEWIRITKSFYPYIRGSLVPEEIFDKAIKLKEEFTTLKPKTKNPPN